MSELWTGQTEDEISHDTQSIFSSILLIDAEPLDLSNHATVFEHLVGDIATACSGVEALEAIESQYFELIILSLNLKDISAQHLLSSVQVLRPTLPVIIISAPDNLEGALLALRDGAWDYIIHNSRTLSEDDCKRSLSRVADRLMTQLREVELRSERNAFSDAVQTAVGGLAIINSSGLVSFTNPAFHDFLFCLGYTRKENIPLNLVELIKNHDLTLSQQFDTALRETHGANSIWESELGIFSNSLGMQAQDRYFSLSLSYLGGDQMNSIRLAKDRRQVLWVTEVTERKEFEKFQRDVLSTTTHDLKGPLGTILCAAELILEDEGCTSTDALNMIGRIESAAQKALNHIEEFLSERRLEDGAILVNPEQFLLKELVDETISDHSIIAKDSGITIEALPIDPYLPVFAEKVSLSRVFDNIIANAIKFSPPGSSITISAQSAQNMCRIQISDTGPGIEPEARRSLFDRYSRLEKHKNVKGSGLGLFIVKSIVEAHGGRIEVESQLGVGTSFLIYLPNNLNADKPPHTHRYSSPSTF